MYRDLQRCSIWSHKHKCDHPHGTGNFLCTRRFNEGLFHLKGRIDTQLWTLQPLSSSLGVMLMSISVFLKTHSLKNMPGMFQGMASMKGIILNSWNSALTLKRGVLEVFFLLFFWCVMEKKKREWVTKPRSDIQTMPFYYFQGTCFLINASITT